MDMPDWNNATMDMEEDFIPAEVIALPQREQRVKYCALEEPDCEACQ